MVRKRYPHQKFINFQLWTLVIFVRPPLVESDGEDAQERKAKVSKQSDAYEWYIYILQREFSPYLTP